MEFRRVLFRSEERQRALLLGEAQDGTQDAKAVPEGAELAERALRTLLVGRHDLAHRHAQFQGVHCQLGLNLETLRQGRKGLHEAARARAVAGEDIVAALAEESANEWGEHPVAELVSAAVGLLRRVVASRVAPVQKIRKGTWRERRYKD